jgi:hypothetical protein
LNIFEGARRTVKLLAGLWVVGWCLFGAVQHQPFISVDFEVVYPNGPVIARERTCQNADLQRWHNFTTETGTRISGFFCFVAIPFGERLLVPYARKGDAVYGQESFRPEVQDYAALQLRGFKPDADMQRALDALYWPAMWGAFWPGAVIVACGLALLFAATWAIGWIVRGFLGIPRGQDHKPPGGRAS